MKRATNVDGINNNTDKTYPKSFLCNFGYVDYIVLASTISIALGEDLSANDLNVLASFFAVLSDELALIASVQSCNSYNDSGSDDFTFVPPDVAMTSNNKDKKNIPRKRTVIKKKVIKKKRKKRKDT